MNIEFAWMKKVERPSVREDCVCPRELAARLVDLLLAGDQTGDAAPAKVAGAGGAA